MLCPRCGHRMENEEANYCGQCGALLRALAPVLDDDSEAPDDFPEARHDPWRDVPSYQGHDRYTHQDIPPSAEPSGPPAHLDAVSLDVTRILALRDRSILQRPTIVPPGAERPAPSGSVPDAPAGLEAPLPLLTRSPATEGTDAEEAPTAWVEAAKEHMQGAEDIPAPSPAPTPAVTSAELLPVPPGVEGCLRIAGCTISIHPGRAPLVEVGLDQGAVLSLAIEGLLWASDQLQIETVSGEAPDGDQSETTPRAPRLQARGPGTLALSPGMACTILPVELTPGAILEVAAGVLLAWSPGLRVWRRGRQSAFPAGRLSAVQPALALLSCPGIARQIELDAGAWITVAPHALIATVGAIGCATLRRYRTAEESPLEEYRLSGPGWVLLGASRPLGARR